MHYPSRLHSPEVVCIFFLCSCLHRATKSVLSCFLRATHFKVLWGFFCEYFYLPTLWHFLNILSDYYPLLEKIAIFSKKKKWLFENSCYLWTWYIELGPIPLVILSGIIFICFFWGIPILAASVVLFFFHYFISGFTISMSAQFFWGREKTLASV